MSKIKKKQKRKLAKLAMKVFFVLAITTCYFVVEESDNMTANADKIPSEIVQDIHQTKNVSSSVPRGTLGELSK